MRRPREVGEVVERWRRWASIDAGVDLGAAVEAGAHRDPAAAPAEGDAAVGRGAEVVDEGAAVGDRLAAGPADLLEHVGDRLGDDDVGGGDGEPAAQRAAAAFGGAADREDAARGADPGAGRGASPRPRRAASRKRRTGEDS